MTKCQHRLFFSYKKVVWAFFVANSWHIQVHAFANYSDTSMKKNHLPYPCVHIFRPHWSSVCSGGLFDDSEHSSTESAFRYAIYRVNEDKTLLSRTRLSYDIQHLPAVNSFLAAKKGQAPGAGHLHSCLLLLQEMLSRLVTII